MKPKAPRWLTQSFADGVAERDPWACALAEHDPLKRPCSDKAEIFHYVNRQRIENALGALMPMTWDAVEDVVRIEIERAESYSDLALPDFYDPALWAPELILLAAWDPRVGGIGCSEHHPRIDSHLAPLPAERLIIPYHALPSHVTDWGEEKGLESQLEARFPKQEVVS